jgi:poly-gamma-glutamate synthesis protein (capsule biosynthesis protein)
MHAILDGPLSRALPLKCRRWTERAALKAMRFQPNGGELRVASGAATASLVAVGDISLHFHARTKHRDALHRLLDGMAPALHSADLRVGNLESVLTSVTTPASAKGAFLRGAPELVEVLDAGGLDAVTCANNHCLDFGPEALGESMSQLGRHGIRTCGVGASDAEARRPALLTAGGLSVGMLGYSDDFNVAPRWEAGARPAAANDDDIVADVRRLREQVDLVVLQLHWGYEWSMYPLLSHRDRARRFAEAGADVVLCHHAHVLMGMEAWKGSVIAYGLGNFLFGWRGRPSHPWRNRSHVIRVSFNAAGVVGAEAIPCVTRPDHSVVPLGGVLRREVLGAHHVLRRTLANDARLGRIEDDRMVREAESLFHRLARSATAEDGARTRELARHLGAPRQRALVAALRSGRFAAGPELAEILDRVAHGHTEPGVALAAAREAAGGRAAELLRRLAAGPQRRGEPLGRVP